MNYFPPPLNYLHIIGTLSLIVAMLCLVATFYEKKKSHATKLFAIMLVSSISFFASHGVIYFVAVFVVATAVTELEFLQTLAAIISRDKNYFDFKKETLSYEEQLRKMALEATIDNDTPELKTEEPKLDTSRQCIDFAKISDISSREALKLSLKVEEKTLEHLSLSYGKIEQGIRFRKDNRIVDFDGIIQGKGNQTTKVFEVRWIRNSKLVTPVLAHTLNKINEMSDVYTDITKNRPEIHLVLITNKETSIEHERKMEIIEKGREKNVNILFFSLGAIGFDVSGDVT